MVRSGSDLHEAAAELLRVIERVGGAGGVFEQLRAGEWDAQLSSEEARDLADLLRVAADRLRFTRAAVPSSSDLPPDASSGDSSLPAWLPLNRKERYYTGTVLPMLVGSDGFAHLHRLLQLCGLDEVEVEIRGLGVGDVNLVTEYGFAESVTTDSDKKTWPGPLGADTPDIVVYGSDWLLAIEAKMFHNPGRGSLEAQMKNQAALVETWATTRGLDPHRVAHVLLLPERLARRVGELAYPVITWQQVLDAYRAVGPRHWSTVLSTALARHAELESKGAASGTNASGKMSGGDLLQQVAEIPLDVDHVGRQGGRYGAAFASDLETGGWRTHQYEVRSGPLPGNENWFAISEFVFAVTEAETKGEI